MNANSFVIRQKQKQKKCIYIKIEFQNSIVRVLCHIMYIKIVWVNPWLPVYFFNSIIFIQRNTYKKVHNLQKI